MTSKCRALNAVLLVLLLAGCVTKEPEPSVEPPPKPHPAQRLEVPFTFGLHGDTRTGHEVHRKIAGRLLVSGARFIINTGDLIMDGAKRGQRLQYREITRALREKMPYHAAKGNHDVSKGRGYFNKEFTLKLPYYTERKGPVEFFFLDTNALGKKQLAWFDKAAAASDARIKIAVLHHPSYSLMKGRQKEAGMVRDTLHERLVRAGFCGVFNGHDHYLYATLRDGIRYVITGGAGAPLYEIDKELAVPGDIFASLNHYLLMDVGAAGIKARVYTPEGEERPNLGFAFCEAK